VQQAHRPAKASLLNSEEDFTFFDCRSSRRSRSDSLRQHAESLQETELTEER